MNRIKGFITNVQYADNTAGTVSPLGELDTYSRTFSRDIGYYANDIYPDVELACFFSKNDLDAVVTVPPAVSNTILQLGHWVYNRYTAGTIPGEADKATFLLDLAAAFPSATLFAVNELIELASPTKNIPDYVEFVITESGEDYTVRVWFKDDRFRTQYDEYEIIVIPPLDNVDDLNNSTAFVSPLLAAMTPQALVLKIQTATGNNPASLLKTQSFTWVDPTFPVSTRPTVWTLLIYGAAGNDSDNIKAAIRAYIDVNGDALFPWAALLPDLYAENEFVIIPMWNRIATPETNFDYGIYSPTVSLGEMVGTAEDLLPDTYAAAVTIATFIDNNLQSSNVFWRSAAILVIGNPNNSGAVFKFNEKFPDYMSVPIGSTDAARMQPTTFAFASKLNEALEHARTMTGSSPVPLGFNRAKRGTKVYLTFDVDGTTYLITTKFTFIATIP